MGFSRVQLATNEAMGPAGTVTATSDRIPYEFHRPSTAVSRIRRTSGRFALEQWQR